VAFGLPIAVIGAGLGQGKAAAAALEGVARQPEAAGKIQTMMIIALALIESLVIYALLMFFMLQGKLPTVTVADLAGLK
jgi:F-type H+-transporting ATPase subunit c